MIKVGDRIEVVGWMHDDPTPPPIGATGTIVEVGPQVISFPPTDDGRQKIYVDWDGGVMAVRSLLIPHDRHVFRVIGKETD